jgi:hypothetical protein
MCWRALWRNGPKSGSEVFTFRLRSVDDVFERR